ncbi:MAG TPA: gamma-glutamyltransferase [Acidimicrobiia bacterium]|nr:gamma-glutamyltransferase [Acidimicrobiia bacterium]
MTAQQGYGPAVVTPHVLATQAAMEILTDGGSAADAMVAANAVLGVVAPETCGIGGDLFALIHMPGQPRPEALNASGAAGTGADPDALIDEGHTALPPFHPQTVTVPGCVDGWERLLERFGQLPLERLLRPALRLAEDGFPASVELANAFSSRRGELAHQEAARGLYPGGEPPALGSRIHRPGLHKTLLEISRHGAPAFYQGPVAELISQATGGVITPEDLARVAGEWVEPIAVEVFGLTGWTVPLNSQGYLTLAAAAAYASLSPPGDPEAADSWHLAIESYRAMAIDRNEVVADPRTAPLASGRLVAMDRIRDRAAMVDRDRASAFATPREVPGGTAYLCAVDNDGLGVSFIQSNFMGIGSGIGAGGAGFFLHNRGAGFDLRPGHPNRLAPGKRPLHTLSPSLWTRKGDLACLLGTRGGDYQPQLLLQMAIRLFHGGIDPGDAQARPRWMIDRFSADSPDIAVEASTPAPMVAALKDRGHRIEVRAETQHGWGPISVIAVDEHGLRTAAADPRVATATAAVY